MGDGDGADDEVEIDADAEAADEVEIADIIKEVRRKHELSSGDERSGRLTVTKVRANCLYHSMTHHCLQLVELAKRVFHSSTIRTDLKSCCAKEKTPELQIIRAITTRWNSLALAIGRALKLRAALVRLLNMPKYDKIGKKGLARFKLSDE